MAVFDNLAPGTYQVKATADSFRPITTPFNVRRGDNRTTLRLALATIEQTVVVQDQSAADRRDNGFTLGNVIYLSTFSKTLAPGIRLAWIVAPEDVIVKLVQLKQAADLHTSTFNQYVAYETLADPLRELVTWVERGTTPTRATATGRDADGNVTRTRPVFAYPQRAVYDGTGSIDDAANFRPAPPTSPVRDVVRWAGEKLYAIPGPVAP